MGYSQVAYPSYVVLRTALAIENALADLKCIAQGKQPPAAWPDYDRAQAVFQDAVRQQQWEEFERRHGRA
jgi:hypothetical protein